MESPKNNIYLISFFVIVAALTRLLPHPENFTAIGAMALFGGAYFNKKSTAFLFPVAAMLFSDLILQFSYITGAGSTPGFHFSMPFVYVAFALTVAVGFWVKKNIGFFRVLGGGLAASLVFFFVSNFAVWAEGYYGFTIQGLISCYVAAIPFHRTNLIADFFYIGVMFGSFEYLKKTRPQLAFATR